MNIKYLSFQYDAALFRDFSISVNPGRSLDERQNSSFERLIS